MNPHELKALESRLSQAEAEVPGLKAAMVEAQKAYETKARLVQSLKQQIDAAKQKAKSMVVTEHALLRFFERVLGFDLEAIRRQILPEETERTIRCLGNGSYPVSNGGKEYRVCVRGHSVTTIEI